MPECSQVVSRAGLCLSSGSTHPLQLSAVPARSQGAIKAGVFVTTSPHPQSRTLQLSLSLCLSESFTLEARCDWE